MRIKLKDDRGASVRGSMRGVQLVIGRERELRRGVRAGRVPGYASVHRACWIGLRGYVVSSTVIVLVWAALWMWVLPRVLGLDPLPGDRSMFALFAEWFPAASARDISTPALVLIVAYPMIGMWGGGLFLWPMYRRYVVPHAIRRTLLSRLCPACEFSLRDLLPQADGCTVCPECGAAWKIPEGAMTLEPVEPTSPKN